MISSASFGFEFERDSLVDGRHQYDFDLIEVGVLLDFFAEIKPMELGDQHVADHGIGAFF